MFVNVVCDRCSSIIHKMKVLRSVKEISNQLNNLCPCCGALLNPKDFVVKATKKI